MPTHARRWFPVLALAALLAAALPACSTAPDAAGLHMLPMDELPGEVRSAPNSVRTAYQFAAANPDVMENLPCYCGCGSIGHDSNYDCYVADVDANGAIRFDGHALGCSICVDITLDAMRLIKEGKSVPEIRAYVDATYSKYGTSNMQ
ncbi:MAG: PCYCGC motif-containing (lipo)protein [Chloroflexota bacterium]